jgi:hypothetical protein
MRRPSKDGAKSPLDIDLHHQPIPHDLGRRVHDLVHGYQPLHGGGSPLSAPHLRALLEVLEAEGHDVMELREELAHLLRALMRARHGGVKLESRRSAR